MTCRTVRRNLSAILLILLVAVTSCNTAEREANFNEFLESHDPALKAKRDELLVVMDGIREKQAHLHAIRSNYQSEAARQRIGSLIEESATRLKNLEGALASIDEKIELAMINRDLARADAGGLRSKEADELSATTGELLDQANQLRAILENPDASNTTGIDKKIISSQESIYQSQENPEESLPVAEKITDASSDQVTDEKTNQIHSPNTNSATRNIQNQQPTSVPQHSVGGSKSISPPSTNSNLRLAEARSSLVGVNTRIEHDRARYRVAADTINRLTNFKRTPVREGSQAYYRCVEASRIMHEVQLGAPKLLAEKARLEALIKELE